LIHCETRASNSIPRWRWEGEKEGKGREGEKGKRRKKRVISRGRNRKYDVLQGPRDGFTSESIGHLIDRKSFITRQ